MRDEKFKHLKLRVLPKEYKYVLFESDYDFLDAVAVMINLPKDELCFSFRCDDEFSMIVPNTCKVRSHKEEKEWKAMRIVGEMPFGTVQGLIASLSSTLQKGQIGTCAVSTYLTDVFFIRSKNLDAALTVLKNEGWEFTA